MENEKRIEEHKKKKKKFVESFNNVSFVWKLESISDFAKVAFLLIFRYLCISLVIKYLKMN